MDENVNFEETEKKLQNDKQKNKKNYTVNEILDYKNEMKIASKQNKERDKSEEIKINNCNERKMSLIDERDEQSNFEQNKKEDNKFNKIDKNNILRNITKSVSKRELPAIKRISTRKQNTNIHKKSNFDNIYPNINNIISFIGNIFHDNIFINFRFFLLYCFFFFLKFYIITF